MKDREVIRSFGLPEYGFKGAVMRVAKGPGSAKDGLRSLLQAGVEQESYGQATFRVAR